MNYKNLWFTEEAAQKLMDQFRADLRRISDGIRRRNRDVESPPSEYLLPDKIYMRFDA